MVRARSCSLFIDVLEDGAHLFRSSNGNRLASVELRGVPVHLRWLIVGIRPHLPDFRYRVECHEVVLLVARQADSAV